MDGEKEEVCEWLLEGLENLKISRKRRASASERETNEYDSDEYDDDEKPPPPEPNVDCQRKQGRLDDGEAAKQISESDKIMTGILKAILTFSDDDIRRMSSVSKYWHKEIDREFRGRWRNANHPFLLLWEAKRGWKRFDFTRFLRCLVNQPNEPNPLHIQAVFIAASDTFKYWDLPFDEPIRRGEIDPLKGLPCTLAFSDRVMITTPDFRKTREACTKNYIENVDFKLPEVHACQALCIPYSDRFIMRSFTVPMWDQDENIKAMELEKLRLQLLGASMAPPGKTLQGIILMSHFLDGPLLASIENRLSLENRPIPFIGGTFEVVRSSLVNENGKIDPVIFACGWAIMGTTRVRVSTIVLEIQNIPFIEAVFQQIAQHFIGATNGFILVFYTADSNSLYFANLIRSYTPPGIPIVGVKLDMFMFVPQSRLTLGAYEPYVDTTNFDETRIKTVCLLVRY